MKSYAVDSIYAFIIVVAVFLVLPFFVPMEEDEYVSAPVGEYSIEEEKPEIFTRIIDRVSSFYRLKKKKKASFADSLSSKNSSDEKGKPFSAGSSAGEGGGEDTSNALTAALPPSEADDRASSPIGLHNASVSSIPSMAELDGKEYKIMPDPYGNQYVMVKGGPIALKYFLAKGGRIVKPAYNYQKNVNLPVNMKSANIRYGGGDLSSGHSGSAYVKGDISSYKGRGGGKIRGFNQGKAAELREEAGGASRLGSRGVNSDFDISGFDFGSGESFGELRKNLSAKSGGGSGGDNAEDQANRTPKAYKLQNASPFVSENSMGVSLRKENDGITIDSESTTESELNTQEQQVSRNLVSISIKAGYENSLGIIPDNAGTRKAMTRELLGNSTFIGSSEQGQVEDPWILPDNIDNGPGKEFFEANKDVLLGSEAVSFKEWEDNDIYYNNVRGEIENTTKGAVTPLIMINGQKGPFTMQVMPEDSYYYKVTSNLLNNKVRKVDEGGEVDLNRIDRNRVLVVVPERPLAENLKKDGYKVAVFDKYIVTPGNLKNFYDQTANAIKDIEEGKKADQETKKQDIARLLKD